MSIEHSGQIPLKLTIIGRPIHNWEGISTLVRPIYERIIHLSILKAPHFVPFADECIAALFSLLKHLGHPPNLGQLIIDETMTPKSTQFDSLKLAATVQLVGKFSLERPRFPDSRKPGRFFNIIKYDSFDINRRTDMPLFPLGFSYDPYANVVGELTTSAKVPLIRDSVHYLERYRCFEQFIFLEEVCAEDDE